VSERHVSVPGHASQLAVLMRFLHEFWSDAKVPPAAAMTFELALEEAFMNVVMHGSPTNRVARVDVSLAIVDGELTLIIEDDGPPFDPLTLATPNISANLNERRVGGLGVFLMRKMMDNVRYQRLESRNQLQMIKRVGNADE
jgi:serine/threonine-protein kinase RsbW